MFTAPYHLSSNGQAERTVHTFKEALKKLRTEGKTTLRNQIYRFLFSFRTTPHTATAVSPAELILKRQLQTAFHLVKPDTYHRIQCYQANIEQGTNVMIPLRQFEVDDRVLVRNFGAGKRWM